MELGETAAKLSEFAIPNPRLSSNSDSPQLDEPLPKKSWLCSKENVSPIPETAIPIRFTHHQKKSEGKKFRILLDEIRQLTFVVQDQQVLANLYKELSSLRDEIQQSQDGLVIEGGESSPFMRISIKMENKARSSIENRYKTSLPKKKPKNRYTARVGVKAAMKRKTCFVHVPVTPTTEYRTAFYKETKPAIFPEQTISKEKEEETSNEEGKVEPVNASKSDETTTTSKGSENCERETDVYGKQECQFGKLKENSGKEGKMEGSPSPKLYNKNETKNEKKETVKKHPPAAVVIDDDSSSPKVWLTLQNVCPDDPESRLTILEATKNNILDKNGWLYDTEINAGQILLKKQFPLVDGLCDPAIRGHLVDPATSEFVQIINVGHWLCLSTIGVSHPGTVRVFDSLFIKPNAIAVEHACQMLLHAGDTVTFINEKVQKQIGSADCCLFALEFATDLCQGLDLTTQRYDQALMRQHYVTCLESAKVTPFPKTIRRVPHHVVENKTLVQIFCKCRLPNDKKEYVMCFRYSSWYHPECVQVPDWAINSKRKWQCQKCKDHKTLRLQNSLA